MVLLRGMGIWIREVHNASLGYMYLAAKIEISRA